MSQLSRNSIALLREQLRTIKDEANCDKAHFAAEIQKIESTWITINGQHDEHERELINRLTVDHELELTDIRKILMTKDDLLIELRAENSKLLEKLANTELEAEKSETKNSDQIDALKVRIVQLEELLKENVNNHEIGKQKAVNETKDRLIREHKTEMESLRCRYKLMKNVDRTPSDTSLEKIDRPELATLQASSPTSSQSLYRRILDEKERQLDAANSQIELLTKESDNFKKIIQSLTDGDGNESLAQLKEHMETVQKDNLKLRQKLKMERSRRMEGYV